MAKAIWMDTVIAESDSYEVVEGNHYFPPQAVHMRFFQSSDTRTICPWKGEAHYYDVSVNGTLNKDAAWFYPAPKKAAESIAGFVAFWKGVRVEL